MDWQALQETMPWDHDLPPRAFRVGALDSVLMGTQYRGLQHSFEEELSGAGEYVPLRKRRPSVTGGAANAIVLSAPEAEAKFLEINGSAAAAVLAQVQHLRGVALEAVHGNRADPDRLSAAQSGRAMELMCQPLVWLADRLRTSYGEGALLSLYGMVCAAYAKVAGGVVIGGEKRWGSSAASVQIVVILHGSGAL